MTGLTEESINCPYCGEDIDVIIEPMDDNQEYIEDCQVCCRPIVFHIDVDFEGTQTLYVHSENETY
ncbi:CPXCG motif-containing cysteine-rich protein [Marinomonas algarum]|uniref:CPXCG motif-containing cysteine-rich protein n=1 Tax=Marinomonas algarum TaxID=2883105 RepID=A0A9X1LB59_9GAMM|nr:CPXCG motif-containing cysteine-rich protein [Marinomonas algarum]MCB5160454.1 CPXCG motif-containing cysteine-rich protein [Marinomonas algarum]